MNYREAISYLDSQVNLEERQIPIAGQTGDLSNEGIAELLSVLGDPHKSFRTIHVTGTNGKGSTASVIAALLGATDLSVGSYTSPHLDRVNERIQWNGQQISDEEFARIVELIASVLPLVGSKLSWFELVTVAGFVWFSELAVDVAVVEVGLLGTNDATNVINADVAVITNIGKDHTDGIGKWRQKIAEEKSGIIKPNSTVVLGADVEELQPIFEAKASGEVLVAHTDFSLDSNLLSVGGRLVDVKTPHSSFDELFLPFLAGYQADNFLTGLVAVEAFFGRPLHRDVVEFALTKVILPCRFEVVATRPVTILDAFHNEDGAKASANALGESFAKLGSWVLIVGLLSDKDPIELLKQLGLEEFDAVICCEPDSPRALDASKLAEAVSSLGFQPEIIHKPLDAYRRAMAICADEDLILAGGSFYMLGGIRNWIQQASQDDK